jgi:hypothetical protein
MTFKFNHSFNNPKFYKKKSHYLKKNLIRLILKIKSKKFIKQTKIAKKNKRKTVRIKERKEKKKKKQAQNLIKSNKKFIIIQYDFSFF